MSEFEPALSVGTCFRTWRVPAGRRMEKNGAQIEAESIEVSFHLVAHGSWRFINVGVSGPKVKKDGELSLRYDKFGYYADTLGSAPQWVQDYVAACREALGGGA